MSLNAELISRLSDKHPKPAEITFQYGTAGFRTLGNVLDSVLFRTGIVAGLRSKKLDGKTVGVMVTASHNPEEDNGVKIVDSRGEMLETNWESHVTALANAQTGPELIDALNTFVVTHKIDLSKPARVVYARDTRPSGPALVAALQHGLEAIGAEARDAGIQTTPVLHYLVRCINTKGTKDEYGVDSPEGYYDKLATAYLKLVGSHTSAAPLVVDCANGVGAFAIEAIAPRLASHLTLKPHNVAIGKEGHLNFQCGADFVKTQQKLPPSLAGVLKPGDRAASFDGDADRIIYYYLDDRGAFHMLDGDKIAALVTAYISDLVKGAGLEGKLEVGVVQTAYANGSSTKYLSDRVPVRCVATGVKHLHHAAEHFSIGVYFEANGHGTVVFSPSCMDVLHSHAPSTPAEQDALTLLVALCDVINQTVGDALSDLLLVEAVLAHRGYGGEEWDSLYADLPNRLVKVAVPDRGVFKTEDAERRLVSPPGVQTRVDELVRQVESGRSFVRPSGTEDVVRVYAEARTRQECDELAFKVAGLVYDSQGGDPAKRPREFL
ncbi:phosphoacetylglucosamine mutase [Auriculariales sp. MPI-PUGE-AT-0066]|nr:phosphoacetylglucosamine mutase [Auriculariales sp. MPI-PUGE-AT-0066]